MPPVKTAVPPQAAPIYDAYRGWLAARGVGNKTFDSGARCFLARLPDPQAWAGLPLAARLAGTRPQLQPLLNFLMLHGHLRPGYDYLLERKLTVMLAGGGGQPARARPQALPGRCRGAGLLGAGPYRHGLRSRDPRADPGRAATGGADRRRLRRVRAGDHRAGSAAGPCPQALPPRCLCLPRGGLPPRRPGRAGAQALHAGPVELGTPPGRGQRAGPPADGGLPGTAAGTHARSSVQGTASELAHFGRFLARHDPGLASLALLDRQRHIEPYLTEVAVARQPPHRPADRRLRPPRPASRPSAAILDAIAEWGWPEAPARRLIFARDTPRLPHPLPRYLPPDAERALLRGAAKPHRTGSTPTRCCCCGPPGCASASCVDLELDCVHEVPGAGAWLKIPLGKLDTERMVPIDEETLALDRPDRRAPLTRPAAAATRAPASWPTSCSPTRAAASPRTRCASELHRAAAEAGIGAVTPHQLRHTYATALVNSGVSLQALMALLGHVSAEMSLRYGRLFDATVRDEYERALTLAKAQLGPVLPGDRTQLPLAAITGGTLARRAADQGPAGRRILPAHRRPGPLRLRQHLRALPELPLRDQLPARAAAAARRRRNARRRRRRPRLGRRGCPAPPPHRTARPAHRPGPCRLITTSWPGSRPPAPSWPPPGSTSRSPK